MENSKVLCVLEREAGVYFAGTDGNGIDVIRMVRWLIITERMTD